MDTFGQTSARRPPAAEHVRWVLPAVILVLVASVALNVLLAQKVRSLSDSRLAKNSEYQLKIGMSVPAITASRLGGEREVISYQGTSQPTVLYVFTPPCTWCARNIDNLKTLLDKESDGYRFIGLSLSEQGLAEYVRKNDLGLPVYSGLSPETMATYKLGTTPQTILISPEGKVLQNWAGAYVGDQKSRIEAFFHVSLPGLKELPKVEAPKN
jgi:peroxiredoxin